MEEIIEKVYEGGGLTLGEVKALYFNSDAILEAPEKVFRIDSKAGLRFYYTFNTEYFRPEYFITVSSMLTKTMPTPPEIIRWISELGWQKAEQHKAERAVYGTLMHSLITDYLIYKYCDLDELQDRVLLSLAEKGQVGNVEAICDELRKDILSFAQFCNDYDVQPLAIEILLVSREFGFGGALDLVCEMNMLKYTDATPIANRKRVRRVIDYKGGKKGFYESNEVQLFAYKALWEENFPNYPIDGVANWAGKDWRKEPSYDFKDYTGKPSAHKLPYLVELAKIDDVKPDKVLKFFSGRVEFGNSIKENYKVVEMDAFITEKMLSRL